jgi:hypothetical protein
MNALEKLNITYEFKAPNIFLYDINSAPLTSESEKIGIVYSKLALAIAEDFKSKNTPSGLEQIIQLDAKPEQIDLLYAGTIYAINYNYPFKNSTNQIIETIITTTSIIAGTAAGIFLGNNMDTGIISTTSAKLIEKFLAYQVNPNVLTTLGTTYIGGLTGYLTSLPLCITYLDLIEKYNIKFEEKRKKLLKPLNRAINVAQNRLFID